MANKKPHRGRNFSDLTMRCPFRGCTHQGLMITKVHCRTHGMEREELFAKYGEPQPVPYNSTALRKNLAEKSIHPNNPPTVSLGKHQKGAGKF